METEMALDEALQRASAEKYRRRTLYNVLVVISTFKSDKSIKSKQARIIIVIKFLLMMFDRNYEVISVSIVG